MKTLLDAEDRRELRGRMESLTSEAERQWGAMSVGEMMVHVREAYRYALGDVEVAEVEMPLPRAVVKRFSLWTPVPWPHGVRTLPEIEAGKGLTPVVGFGEDKTGLLEAYDRFAVQEECTRPHPMFGAMQHKDWMRWGYLHADHHLRQFGL